MWALVLKFLWENKIVAIAPGWIALGLLGYHVEFEAAGLKDAVNRLYVKEVEKDLETYHTALCMSPGDSLLLARVRELQQEHRELVGEIYIVPSCQLLLQLR